MSMFFNGRLYTTPTVASQVNTSAMANTGDSTGNVVALLGASIGGAPNTPLVFSNPAAAQAALIGGDLYDAVTRAFAPSNATGGPATVIAIRVNPALRSGLTLLDGSSASVITLASTDYGQYTNQIKVKIQAATGGVGFQVTTSLSPQGGPTQLYTQDNILLQPMTVNYTGVNGSATISITNSTVTLASPTGTPVATIALATYPTVQQLVDFINTVPGFVATVLGGNGAAATLNGLDTATAQDVRTSVYTVNAHLQAVVNYFNGASEILVTATRTPGAGTLPAVIPFTYLTGGSDGTITNTEWANAFTTLQGVDCQWLTPLSSSPSIGAMADAHAQFMSGPGQRERRAITGSALATSNSAGVALAAALNSDRTSLVIQGIYDFNAAGALTLYPPYIAAAMMAAMFAGVAPGVALTNKAMTIRGVERTLLIPTDTDVLIQGGIIPISSESTGFNVVESISTWLVDKNFVRREQSCGAALDFVCRNVRAALAPFKGGQGNPQTLSEVASATETVLTNLAKPAPVGPGVIVGDATNPAFKSIQAQLVGDTIGVQFQCSPVIPVNFIGVTVAAVPYSGSISL